MLPGCRAAYRAAKNASSCVWTPLSTMGKSVCSASHGSVLSHVKSAAVPKNNCCPTPAFASGLFPSPPSLFTRSSSSLSISNRASIPARSSSSRLLGTGASSVSTTNLYHSFSLLIRASIASLLARSFCTYSCQPKTCPGRASATICSGDMEALCETICMAPKREMPRAMPASPSGWARRAMAAGETYSGVERGRVLCRREVEVEVEVTSTKMRGRRRMDW